VVTEYLTDLFATPQIKEVVADWTYPGISDGTYQFPVRKQTVRYYWSVILHVLLYVEAPSPYARIAAERQFQHLLVHAKRIPEPRLLIPIREYRFPKHAPYTIGDAFYFQRHVIPPMP
jgi:hypothetical protein